MPKTAEGWRGLALAEKWDCFEQPGRGRGGVKREYVPPLELLELIRRHMRGEAVTEEEVSRARAVRSAGFQHAPGRSARTEAATAINADGRYPSGSAPSPPGVAEPGPAGAPTAAATGSSSPGARTSTGRLADPTDDDRLQMLLALLRTMEHHLKAPVSAEVAARMLEVVDAWHNFAARQPAILARLEAVRAAANLYLVR
jgi:hypothetical protein